MLIFISLDLKYYIFLLGKLKINTEKNRINIFNNHTLIVNVNYL